MELSIRSAVCAGIVCLLATAAQAEDIPNLAGTWTARTKAVLEGGNPHRPSGAKGPVFPNAEIEFTYVVKEQHDSRFAGEMSGGGFTESFVGDMAPPNYKSGVIAGRDGIFQFSVRNPDTLDVCYAQFGPDNKTADCFVLERKK